MRDTTLVVLVVPENFETIAVDTVRAAVARAPRSSDGQMGAGPTSQGIVALADSARLVSLEELKDEMAQRLHKGQHCSCVHDHDLKRCPESREMARTAIAALKERLVGE